jgi:hypothetical protein
MFGYLFGCGFRVLSITAVIWGQVMGYIMKKELEWMWKKVGVACFKTLVDFYLTQ